MHEICKFTIHGKALILLLWEGSNVKSTARLRLTNVHRLPQALRLAVSNTVAALADKLGGVGSWHGGFGPPGFWNLTVSCWIFSKQFFLVSREKKQFHHLSKNFTPSTKIFLATLGTSGKIHYCPPLWKKSFRLLCRQPWQCGRDPVRNHFELFLYTSFCAKAACVIIVSYCDAVLSSTFAKAVAPAPLLVGRGPSVFAFVPCLMFCRSDNFLKLVHSIEKVAVTSRGQEKSFCPSLFCCSTRLLMNVCVVSVAARNHFHVETHRKYII